MVFFFLTKQEGGYNPSIPSFDQPVFFFTSFIWKDKTFTHYVHICFGDTVITLFLLLQVCFAPALYPGSGIQ